MSFLATNTIAMAARETTVSKSTHATNQSPNTNGYQAPSSKSSSLKTLMSGAVYDGDAYLIEIYSKISKDSLTRRTSADWLALNPDDICNQSVCVSDKEVTCLRAITDERKGRCQKYQRSEVVRRIFDRILNPVLPDKTAAQSGSFNMASADTSKVTSFNNASFSSPNADFIGNMPQINPAKQILKTKGKLGSLDSGSLWEGNLRKANALKESSDALPIAAGQSGSFNTPSPDTSKVMSSNNASFPSSNSDFIGNMPQSNPANPILKGRGKPGPLDFRGLGKGNALEESSDPLPIAANVGSVAAIGGLAVDDDKSATLKPNIPVENYSQTQSNNNVPPLTEDVVIGAASVGTITPGSNNNEGANPVEHSSNLEEPGIVVAGSSQSIIVEPFDKVCSKEKMAERGAQYTKLYKDFIAQKDDLKDSVNPDKSTTSLFNASREMLNLALLAKNKSVKKSSTYIIIEYVKSYAIDIKTYFPQSMVDLLNDVCDCLISEEDEEIVNQNIRAFLEGSGYFTN